MEQPQTFSESDIPAEWRIDLWKNYAEVNEFTPEESDAVEMDRR